VAKETTKKDLETITREKGINMQNVLMSPDGSELIVVVIPYEYPVLKNRTAYFVTGYSLLQKLLKAGYHNLGPL